MTQRKRPKKVSRPKSWKGELKKRAADKAREKAEPAPEQEFHSTETDPTELIDDSVPPAQTDFYAKDDTPPAETDIPDTETAIPAGPSIQERERVAAQETQVIEYPDDTGEPVFSDGDETGPLGDEEVLVGESEEFGEEKHDTELTDIAGLETESLTKTEPLTDAETDGSEEQLESVLDSKPASDYTAQSYEGISVTEKYAAILQLASGEKVVIDEKNKGFWEKTLQELDIAYETASDAEKQEAEGFRNYVFEAYAGAAGCKSKDKEVLIYVLSELAEASAGRGEYEKAFNYARRARQVSKTELIKNPCAESLHKWGMLEHNVEFYESQLKENTVTAEAE